jgi:hypoxanthine-guanine phosphoribosyltransferase
VLLVDDILDSGMTLRLMLEHLRPHAIELRSSVLVQKDSPLITSDQLAARPNADYVGLRFADPRWFSGCGMDMPNDPMERARDAEFIIAYPPLA